MIKIAFIIPLYFGNKYIPNLLEMLLSNVNKLSDNYSVEAIFVNDSPQEKISKLPNVNKIKITLIDNEVNKGIHYSRVNGLKATSADYVVFLDQDDIIMPNFLHTQLMCIKDADVTVGNGIAELYGAKKYLYRYKIMHESVKWKWCHALFGCRIISPGHCMIKRSSIPKEWTENIIINNGADDFFLWLLMLSLKKRIVINRNNIYVHRYTEENASLNVDKMDASLIEVITLLEKTNVVDFKTTRIIYKQINKNTKQYLYRKILRYIICIVEKINYKRI